VADRCARQARDLLDRLANGAGEAHRQAAADAFGTSSRYEWMFWEMCDKGEGWRI
jgi:thiaminase